MTTPKGVEFQLEMEKALEAMRVDWLQHQKVKRLATISEYCFKLGVEIAGALIDIENEIGLMEPNQEKEAIEAIKNILKKNLSGAKCGFTPEKAKNEGLKNFLNETIGKIKAGETPKKIEEQSPGKTSGTLQPPVAETACCLEKGTPVFHGNRDEIVKNWLFVVKNKMATMKIGEKQKISCVIPFMKDRALNTAVNYVAQHGYENWMLLKSI